MDRMITLDNFVRPSSNEKDARPPAGNEGSSPIRPHLVLAGGVSKATCDHITKMWHSYVGPSDRGARALDYLVYGDLSYTDKPIVGTIGFAFGGVRLPGAIMDYYSIGQIKRETLWVEKSRRIAICYRYTLKRGLPLNFASRTLGVAMRMLRRDWSRRYGVELMGAFTLVKPPWKGSCFLACNYELVGYTSGENMTFTMQHNESPIMEGIPLKILAYRYGGRRYGHDNDKP